MGRSVGVYPPEGLAWLEYNPIHVADLMECELCLIHDCCGIGKCSFSAGLLCKP